jgi:hypothetical protein
MAETFRELRNGFFMVDLNDCTIGTRMFVLRDSNFLPSQKENKTQQKAGY